MRREQGDAAAGVSTELIPALFQALTTGQLRALRAWAQGPSSCHAVATAYVWLRAIACDAHLELMIKDELARREASQKGE